MMDLVVEVNMYATQSVVVLEKNEHNSGSDLRHLPEGGSALKRMGSERNISYRVAAENAASDNISWVEGTVSVTF